MQQNQNRTILLIGNEPDRLESITFTLQQTGYNVSSAGDGREGFRLIRRKRPDLVISEINLPVISGLELCRMIRTDRELWATPLMFLSERQQDGKKLIEILRAGADEFLTEFSSPEHLAIKTEWLIERKYSENYLIHYYEILRSRQIHITQIIKATSNLFAVSELEYSASFLNEINEKAFEKNLGKRIELGMNMIGALANLLEEQVKTLEIWRRSRRAEEFITEQESDGEILELNYEDLTYNLIKDDLPAH